MGYDVASQESNMAGESPTKMEVFMGKIISGWWSGTFFIVHHIWDTLQ